MYRIRINSFLNVGMNLPVKPYGPGISFVGRYLEPLFQFLVETLGCLGSISFCVTFGSLCLPSNFSFYLCCLINWHKIVYIYSLIILLISEKLII